MRLLVILLYVMKGELLMGEMALHVGDGGGCMAAWRSSRDGKGEAGGMEIDTDSGLRQNGLNNVAQTHSTS